MILKKLKKKMIVMLVRKTTASSRICDKGDPHSNLELVLVFSVIPFLLGIYKTIETENTWTYLILTIAIMKLPILNLSEKFYEYRNGLKQEEESLQDLENLRKLEEEIKHLWKLERSLTLNYPISWGNLKWTTKVTLSL